jgi:hypothetical protein
MEVSGQLHAPVALRNPLPPITNWVGGWVGPRAVPNALEKIEIP